MKKLKKPSFYFDLNPIVPNCSPGSSSINFDLNLNNSVNWLPRRRTDFVNKSKYFAGASGRGEGAYQPPPSYSHFNDPDRHSHPQLKQKKSVRIEGWNLSSIHSSKTDLYNKENIRGFDSNDSVIDNYRALTVGYQEPSNSINTLSDNLERNEIERIVEDSESVVKDVSKLIIVKPKSKSTKSLHQPDDSNVPSTRLLHAQSSPVLDTSHYSSSGLSKQTSDIPDSSETAYQSNFSNSTLSRKSETKQSVSSQLEFNPSIRTVAPSETLFDITENKLDFVPANRRSTPSESRLNISEIVSFDFVKRQPVFLLNTQNYNISNSDNRPISRPSTFSQGISNTAFTILDNSIESNWTYTPSVKDVANSDKVHEIIENNLDCQSRIIRNVEHVATSPFTTTHFAAKVPQDLENYLIRKPIFQNIGTSASNSNIKDTILENLDKNNFLTKQNLVDVGTSPENFNLTNSISENLEFNTKSIILSRPIDEVQLKPVSANFISNLKSEVPFDLRSRSIISTSNQSSTGSTKKASISFPASARTKNRYPLNSFSPATSPAEVRSNRIDNEDNNLNANMEAMNTNQSNQEFAKTLVSGRDGRKIAVNYVARSTPENLPGISVTYDPGHAISTNALLLGKYKNRPALPPDDKFFNDGMRRVAQYLHDSFLDQVLCDVAIMTDGGEVLAHQVVLGPYSPTLAALFRQNPSGPASLQHTAQINMADYPREIVADVINFLYTTDIVLDCRNIGPILAVARQLDLIAVIEICEGYLIDTCTMENIILHYSVAANNDLAEIKDKLQIILSEGFGEVSRHKHFPYIPYDRLLSILTSPRLCAKEIDIFLGIVRWLDFNREERMEFVKELIPIVRFQLIDAETLATQVQTVEWVFVDKESRDLISNAYKYHALETINSSALDMFPAQPARCPKSLATSKTISHNAQLALEERTAKNYSHPFVGNQMVAAGQTKTLQQNNHQNNQQNNYPQVVNNNLSQPKSVPQQHHPQNASTQYQPSSVPQHILPQQQQHQQQNLSHNNTRQEHQPLQARFDEQNFSWAENNGHYFQEYIPPTTRSSKNQPLNNQNIHLRPSNQY